MHLQGIKKLLNIPEYTVTDVSLSSGRIDADEIKTINIEMTIIDGKSSGKGKRRG